jgi:Fe-S cluster assembly protein SufD
MNTETLASLAEKKLDTATGALSDYRLTHLEVFKKQGLVPKDPEAYKFTNLASFIDGFEYSAYEADEARFEDYLDADFHTLVFIDGELKNPGLVVAGLTLTTISHAFPTIASKFKDLGPLSHLHHALLGGGIVLEIAAKTKIEKPIRLVNVVTRSGVTAPTFVIKALPFSEAAIFEENYDQAIAHAVINETYVYVETGAQIEHVQLSHGGSTSLLHSTTQSFVERDANYRNVLFNVSGKLNRRNLNLELLGPGANGESYNLYLTNGTEHSDINTIIQHRSADSTSQQIAKGILDGDSKGIFTGKIHIHPQAQRVASGQLNKNLLLSKKAQSHSQPQLEIFADDVKCSHGSTTGQLSDDEVFYFQARGIPAEKARTLLAHGFGLEIVLKIKDKTIRHKAESLVMESLKTKFELGGAK